MGTKIDSLFSDLIELILIAGYSSREQKLPRIQQASIKLDLLKFFIQIAWEIKCLDAKQYGNLSSSLYGIGTMIGAWLRSMKPNDEKQQV